MSACPNFLFAFPNFCIIILCMENPDKSTGENPITPEQFLKDLRAELEELWQNIKDAYLASSVNIRNQLRVLRQAKVEYIFLPIGGTLPERAEPPRSFIRRQLPLPPPALSIEQITDVFRIIADADNVKGVVLLCGGFATGLAALQSVRNAILRLKASGKEVVFFSPYLNLPNYYVASAASRIIAPPSTIFEVIGMRSDVTFYKDALAQLGIQADVVQISPYKTALDSFQHNEPTPEMLAQLNWLLDERFDMVTAEMANGRNLSQEAFQQLVNKAPMFAKEALAAGLIDAVGYEDELAFLLAEEKEEETDEETAVPETENAESETETAEPEEKERPKAQIMPFGKAYPLLKEKFRRRSYKAIGVISLEGLISMGFNEEPLIDLPLPFINEQVAGEASIVRTLRKAEQDDRLAALILHVDSPGGDALASDLIGREVERIAKQKPLVVYFGNMAASGGYYVAAYGRKIVCQPTTITGSIGVINMRLSTSGLYKKAHLNQVSIKRGEHADLYSSNQPMTAEERGIFWQSIQESYRRFKQVVANGRSLPYDELDPICEGRVWTGRQALAHKLVDQHGDFLDAVALAAQLADLPLDDEHDVPVINLYHQDGRHILPKPFEAIEELGQIVLGKRLEQLNGRNLWLMPLFMNNE
jgi:protease-4